MVAGLVNCVKTNSANGRFCRTVDEGAMRLDAFLHQFGFAESRQKAKQLIINGNIYVDDECVRKPSASVTEKNHVEIKGDVMPYVGRGGLKLEAALRQFGLTVQNFAVWISAHRPAALQIVSCSMEPGWYMPLIRVLSSWRRS